MTYLQRSHSEEGSIGFPVPSVGESVQLGLFDNEELGVTPDFKLPEGFYGADARTITPSEWASVLSSASPYPIQPDECMEELDARYEGEKHIGIGVRSALTSELVGFGRLALLGHQGVLLDFTVRPDAQRRGVGKAVLQKRLDEAERLGVTELRTDLASTNTLKHHYRGSGFRRVSSSSVLVRNTDESAVLRNSPFYLALNMLV